nr:hypothetical protein [uncultured Oscillibacter sp.]
MARKKAVPVEEQEPNLEVQGLPEGEADTGEGKFQKDPPEVPGAESGPPEGLPGAPSEDGSPTDGLPEDLGELSGAPGNPPGPIREVAEGLPSGDAGDGETIPGVPPDIPPESGEAAVEALEGLPAGEVPPEPTVPPETAGGSEEENGVGPVSQGEPAPSPEIPETPGVPAGAETSPAEAPPPKTDRQSFYGLNFNELDRDLTAEERQEWNSIYASYRGRSALTGTIIGVDPHSISVRNGETGKVERQTMYCAIVIPYRVRVVIPASEMWEPGHERPDFVLQNMVGASIDFIIIKVDRESGFAIGSRRLAARSQRYFFAHRPALCQEGTRLKCRLLSVGPRRCLAECYGHDIGMTQRDLRYTAIPDLRNEYRPGQELDCVVKSYDPEKEALRISVKETESNPFEGAEFRHPAGSRRQAVIAGKYGGGVFCNLPDGAVCMCNYSYQHEDSDFLVGDTVILVVQRHDLEKRQMYGKILSKW